MILTKTLAQRLSFVSLFLLANLIFAPSILAKDLTAEFDQKHKLCLERIAVDADLAFEEAMIWRDDGGGRRAKHCEAMALFALGQKEEAAYRLDSLAQSSDAGTPAMRADYYLEAANFWLFSENSKKAYDSTTAGLELQKDSVELRIARARAYALLGRYADAEIDLTNALRYQPTHAAALRYRADARRKQGNLQFAKSDIEAALRSDPTSVETAIVRGEINEAMRLEQVGTVLPTQE